MSKLLRANFYRLCRSRALWLCAAGVLVLSAAFALGVRVDSAGGTALDEVFLQVFPFLPVAEAVFTALFLGVEYQDGTLRNKRIAGHSRGAIYAASMVTVTAGCFVLLLAWALGGAVGIARFGWFAAPAGQLAAAAGVILLLTAANAAILTLIGMLTVNRAVSAVVAILLTFALLMAGSSLYNALSEPEMSSAAVITANGVEVGEEQPNPYYVSGVLRDVFQFAVEALPSGQAILLANCELSRPLLSAASSLGIVLLAGAAGIAVFRRKDLK